MHSCTVAQLLLLLLMPVALLPHLVPLGQMGQGSEAHVHV
jgi:hypothetical protein